MPRSKKSAGQPPPSPEPSDADAHEAAENEGMAHVSADELAGSPDIFARKKDAPAETVAVGESGRHLDNGRPGARIPEQHRLLDQLGICVGPGRTRRSRAGAISPGSPRTQ